LNQRLSNDRDATFEFGLDYGVYPELTQLENIIRS
jgi:hypothetical protein